MTDERWKELDGEEKELDEAIMKGLASGAPFVLLERGEDGIIRQKKAEAPEPVEEEDPPMLGAAVFLGAIMAAILGGLAWLVL